MYENHHHNLYTFIRMVLAFSFSSDVSTHTERRVLNLQLSLKTNRHFRREKVYDSSCKLVTEFALRSSSKFISSLH